MKYTDFVWDEETGEAICSIQDKQSKKIYIGIATCHPDDRDFMSEKTGCDIAFRRANIKFFQGLKEEQRIQYKTLNHLYNTIKISKKFNPKSYETKMLLKSIKSIKFDLEVTKEMIEKEKEELQRLIEEKDKFYKRTRARRELAQYN